MSQDIVNDAESRMGKTVDACEQTFQRIRTGRPHPSLLDHIMINVYGSESPLKNVASITVEDGTNLLITAYDPSVVASIEKAIMQSELGMNPQTNGQSIRVPVPPLTEERRIEFIKVVKAEAEKGRVAVRQVRRDAMQSIKKLEKEKEISEDEESRLDTAIQKATDAAIEKIEAMLSEKEKDIMKV